MLFDSLTYPQVTHLWVDDLTLDNLDARLALLNVAAGSRIHIQDRNDSSLYVQFTTTAEPLGQSGYVEFLVTWLAGAGTLVNNGQVAIVSRAPVGGEGGGGDVFGPASSVVDTVATYANTTGKLIQQGSGVKATPTGDLSAGTLAVQSSAVIGGPTDCNMGLEVRGNSGTTTLFNEQNTSLTGTLFVGGAATLNNNLSVGGTVTERGRSVALGEWIDIPYNAANFRGYGSMIWTVEAADHIAYYYTLVGKTLWLQWSFGPTTLSGTASTLVYIKLPAGFVAAKGALSVSSYLTFIGVNNTTAYANIDIGSTELGIARTDQAAFSLGTDTFYTWGQICIAIQ